MYILDFMEFAASKFHFVEVSVFSTLSKALVAVRSGAETSSKAPGNTRRFSAQLSFEKIWEINLTSSNPSINIQRYESGIR